MTRKSSLIAGLIPVSEYKTVQKFFQTISNAEQSPVVLKYALAAAVPLF
jgi:hypothetical protein